MKLVPFAMFVLGAAGTRGQESGAAIDDQGAEVLTRGPVHEAFAGIVSYNPEPGVTVERVPPEAIEELPPAERPEGDNISWIPGYWGWDDERDDHLWISGTWRVLPPGRQWTPGYWGRNDEGYRWISGYWADAAMREVTYLPKPPLTVEAGPNVVSPSRDHSWSPGSWMWQQERYVWSPGYWAEGRADWDWTPAHYVWTPRGYIFVDGYWDYSFDRRGILYSPVYFRSGQYSRAGYQYSPVIAIGLGAVLNHLFLRPKYHHYYFGDYYDRGHRASGYYSPHGYQSSHYGYDPVYSHRRWTNRNDRDWERKDVQEHDYLRDHESARPPRTWDAQERLRLEKVPAGGRRQILIAAPFEQMARNPDRPIKVQILSSQEQKHLADQGRAVLRNREQRRSVEAEARNSGQGNYEREVKPSKATRPASPIVGKAPDLFLDNQAPPQPRLAPLVSPLREARDRRQVVEAPRAEFNIGKPVPRQEGDRKIKERDEARATGRNGEESKRPEGDGRIEESRKANP